MSDTIIARYRQFGEMELSYKPKNKESNTPYVFTYDDSTQSDDYTSPLTFRGWLQQMQLFGAKRISLEGEISDVDDFIGGLFSPQIDETKQVIFLCGMPCSGKTSYRMKHLEGYSVISSDDVIDELAESSGKKYDDFFVSSMEPVEGWVPHPIPWMKGWVPKDMAHLHQAYLVKSPAMEEAALTANKAVVDMCNLRSEQRSRLLGMFKERDYHTTAIWFISYSLSRQIELIEERSKRLGDKSIPAKRIIEMHKGFEIPDVSEFDEIIIIRPTDF